MSIHPVDKRVRVANVSSGIIEVDKMSWPWDVDCRSWVSDNYVPAHPNKASFVSDTLGTVVTVRRAGTPICPGCGDDFLDIDWQIKKMSNVVTCNVTAAMRDGETVLDNLTDTGGNDQNDIRFGVDLVQGVGCYLQLVSNATYYARMRAYDAAGTLLLSVIKAGNSTNAYSTGIFEAAAWLGIAYDAADAANIRRIDVNVVGSGGAGPGWPNPLTDAQFDAKVQARYTMGHIYFGPYDPATPAGPVGPVTHTVSLSDAISFSEALRGGINELAREDIIRFGWRLGDDMIVNQVIAKFDFNATTGVFQTIKVYTFQASINKYGLRDPVVIESKGVRTSLDGIAIMADRAIEIGKRFSEPPVVLDLGILYRRHNFEIADVVEVTHNLIPDPLTGLRGLTRERFEVWRSQPNFLANAFQEGMSLTLLDVDSVLTVPAPEVTTPATFSLAMSETVGLTENLGTVRTP